MATLGLLILAATPGVRGGAVIESDVCVYGGTSGGVTAAVAAARLGKSVALLTLNRHVGGMTASGLGVTDIGPGNNASYVGGLAREFYRRVGQAYGSTNPVYYFEPHVAEAVFGQMLTQAGVVVYTNRRLASVTMAAARLAQLTTEDGSVFRAQEFIDTTYEGDLMAAAGVTFTVGREGTNVYRESLAGIRALGGTYNYDPYVVPGNPASGPLPLVQAGDGGTVGQGDARLQAYNFRLCLTQNPTNQIPIAAPAGYAEAQYELVARYLAARVARDGAVQLNQLIDVQTLIPNGKTDINANGELSTDYVGANYTWATNTQAAREELRQQHEDYLRGLLHFLATGARVPLNVRTQMQAWALARDEFPDTGGWPWQIYVREARRMVSDYVMLQQDATAVRAAPDPIALAAYNLDSHGVQRVASGGYSRWEGSPGGAPPYPYGISYRSIVPRAGECANLLCTFALSASHAAFSSCRMEPVFMMTSQSAGTAAAFAIDDGVAVQQLNYPKLAAQLRADGQLLTWAVAGASSNGLILDQGGPGTAYSSGWAAGANAGGWNGDYWHDGASGKGSKWVRYTPSLPTNGTYEVDAWWVADPNRATNTPFDVAHAAGTNRVLVNQRFSSGGWFKLLTTNFNAGTDASVTLRNDNTAATNFVIADAIRFLPVGSTAQVLPPTIELVASDAVAGEFGPNPARFTLVRSGDTSPPVVVRFTLGGTASNGKDYAAIATNVTLAAGAGATNIAILPVADDVPQGDRTVTLTLLAATNYFLTALSNAAIVLHDRPVDGWRFLNFTANELVDPSIGGDAADPNHNGLPNLVEYALGLSPLRKPVTNLPCARIQNGFLTLTYTRAKAATDIALLVEQSNDLATWRTGPPDLQQMECVDQGSKQLITVQSTTPIGANRAAYLRIRVSRL